MYQPVIGRVLKWTDEEVVSAFLLSFPTSICNPTRKIQTKMICQHQKRRQTWLSTVSCASTHISTTHTLEELLPAFGTCQSGSVSRGLWGLHCWPHLPALVQASFLGGVLWSGVSTASWVLEKSFSPRGQMRGSSQIAPLITFLLSLEITVSTQRQFFHDDKSFSFY